MVPIMMAQNKRAKGAAYMTPRKKSILLPPGKQNPLPAGEKHLLGRGL